MQPEQRPATLQRSRLRTTGRAQSHEHGARPAPETQRPGRTPYQDRHDAAAPPSRSTTARATDASAPDRHSRTVRVERQATPRHVIATLQSPAAAALALIALPLRHMMRTPEARSRQRQEHVSTTGHGMPVCILDPASSETCRIASPDRRTRRALRPTTRPTAHEQPRRHLNRARAEPLAQYLFQILWD